MYIFIFIHVNIFIFISISTYLHICIHIDIYISISIHLYIYIYIYLKHSRRFPLVDWNGIEAGDWKKRRRSASASSDVSADPAVETETETLEVEPKRQRGTPSTPEDETASLEEEGDDVQVRPAFPVLSLSCLPSPFPACLTARLAFLRFFSFPPFV
jgi:hypothetical protein